MPKADPLKRAIRLTDRYQHEKLREELARWSRKETIARNKRLAVQERMEKFAQQMLEKLEHA